MSRYAKPPILNNFARGDRTALLDLSHRMDPARRRDIHRGLPPPSSRRRCHLATWNLLPGLTEKEAALCAHHNGDRAAEEVPQLYRASHAWCVRYFLPCCSVTLTASRNIPHESELPVSANSRRVVDAERAAGAKPLRVSTVQVVLSLPSPEAE